MAGGGGGGVESATQWEAGQLPNFATNVNESVIRGFMDRRVHLSNWQVSEIRKLESRCPRLPPRNRPPSRNCSPKGSQKKEKEIYLRS